jgi:uncharacterized surface protein with fasciclin (FAS1) repeats
MRRRFSLTLIFLLLSSFFLAACGGNGDENTATPEPTEAPTEIPTEVPVPEVTDEPNMSPIPEEIEVQSDFTILVEALEAAELIDMLSGNIQYTIFAPTDAAFEAYFEAQGLTKEELLADTEALTDLLYYHLVAEWLDTEILAKKDDPSLTTLNGEQLVFAIDDSGEVTLNDTVAVVLPDVIASTGVIHAIDTVLTAPVVVEPEETPEPTIEVDAEVTAEPVDDMDVDATDESMEDIDSETTEEPESTDIPESEATESP